MSSRVRPYKDLGASLRRLREKKQETLAEVSGAIEIDLASLERMELGNVRPDEDILLLLINHFDIREDEANHLWRLAGYEPPQTLLTSVENLMSAVGHETSAVHYTDMVHVYANDYGVIVNFMQSLGLSGQPETIVRLGMSKEHVKSVIEVLKRSLQPNEPKALPATANKPKRPQQKTDHQ